MLLRVMAIEFSPPYPFFSEFLEEFARALQMTTTTLYLANYDDLEREGAFLRATQTKPRLLG